MNHKFPSFLVLRTHGMLLLLFQMLVLVSVFHVEDTEASKPKVSRAEKRALKDMNTWFGIQILGFIIICLFIPPLFMFFYELYQDPATPVLRKLLWLRLKELIGYNPYQRYTTRTTTENDPNAALFVAGKNKKKNIDPVGRAIVDDILSDIVVKREKGLLKVNFSSAHSNSNDRNNGSNSNISSSATGNLSSLHNQLLDRSDALLRKRSTATADPSFFPSSSVNAGPP